ncbi:HET-domain-containing protein [Lentithecium fluviatile CBS 122367]|uniref:HET-domain-containing protein n=1 Tax=Lentithecium fluviatile CBS 122367 TaxID=1168545 RepID=A0A6G1J782_9PLEO|nr:HET-domain-containing protein [Lentithecium fluviatile CBS 122367]
MSSTLCGDCVRAFDGKAPGFEPDKTKRVHYLHEDYSSFHQAFQTRCRLCYELWTGFEASTGLPPTRLSTSGLRVTFVVFPIPAADGTIVILWQFDFYVRDSTEHGSILRNRFVTNLTESPPRYLLGAQWYQYVFFSSYTLLPHDGPRDGRAPEQIGSSSKSEPSRALTNAWVKECVQSHKDCKPWRDYHGDRTPPARLLDVGESGDPKIYLRAIQSSEDKPFSDEYTTLSHRWGNVEHPTLTQKTWSQLVEGIKPHTLPKVFRNAVAITRQLCVRYLWIDSLCIFQDSVEDWRGEGMKMGNIYHYGLLNIAATAAEDSEGGLFFDRDPLLVQPLQVTVAWPVYQTDMKRDPLGHVPATVYDCIPQKFWYDNVDGATLNTRAWVMQERILSPRILHCARQQLLWECKTKKACETFPTGIRTPLSNAVTVGERAVPLLDRIGKESFYAFHPGGKIEFLPPTDKTLIQDAYRAWLGLIQAYSTCNITRDSDVLIAYSGLAHKFESFLGDKYVAGILLGDLHRNLLWYTTDASATRLGAWHNQASWLAPSWSWASVKGNVKWDTDFLPRIAVRGETMEGTFLEYVEHHIEALGGDTAGGVSAAWLKVKANLFLLSGDLSWTPSGDFLRSYGPRARHMWLRINDNNKSYRAVAQFDEDAIIKMLVERGGKNVAIVSMPVLSSFRKWWDDKGTWVRELKIQGLLCHWFCMDPLHETGLSRIGLFTITARDQEGQEVLDYFLRLFNSGDRKEEVLL